MTTRELIEKLQTMNPNATILVTRLYDIDYRVSENFEIVDDGDNVTILGEVNQE